MGIQQVINVSTGFLYVLIVLLVLAAFAIYLIATGTDAASFLRGIFTLSLR